MPFHTVPREALTMGLWDNMGERVREMMGAHSSALIVWVEDHGNVFQSVDKGGSSLG